jgi:predicted nucleic acid-binding protein
LLKIVVGEDRVFSPGAGASQCCGTGNPLNPIPVPCFPPYNVQLKTNRLFDTSAIIKYFVTEKGSDTVKSIVDNQMQYSINISISNIARLEFECALWKKTANGQLTLPKTRGIIQRSRAYFREVFRVRDTDPIPAFRSGRPLEYNDLVKKYGLRVGSNDRDVCHLMCAYNYLRCFGGKSLPHIVTSDPDLKKMFEAEGFGAIDPEKQRPTDLENLWK